MSNQSIKFCFECGSELVAGSAFCRNCGKPQSKDSYGAESATFDLKSKNNSSKNKTRNLLVWLILAVGVIAAVIIYLGHNNTSDSIGNDVGQPAPVDTTYQDSYQMGVDAQNARYNSGQWLLLAPANDQCNQLSTQYNVTNYKAFMDGCLSEANKH